MNIKFYHRFFKPSDIDNLPHHYFYGATELEKHNINVSICEDSSLGNRLIRGMKLALKLIFTSKPYDALYAATANGLELLVLLRSMGLYSKPIVVWQHRALKNTDKFIVKKLLQFYYRGFDKMLMFTEKHVKESEAAGVIAPDKLTCLKWGPDLKYYDNIINKEQESSNAANEAYFCSTGRENRDFPTLIKAFEKLPNSKLRIYTTRQHGNMNNEQILADACKDAPNIKVSIVDGLATQNNFLSKEIYRSFCTIICTNEHNYTVGLTSLYEAMALGKAVITSNNPYFPIDVEKEGLGIKIGYGNSDDCIKAVNYLSENKEVAAEMGRKARRFVEQHYNLDSLAYDVATTLRAVSKTPQYSTPTASY
ncbi:glycosyltransferase [Mucilaginibacter sp. PAMB04274]|uniref:glycosyltransferase n=1 Tax=Mucilaginibacter sp. PAMB04274 TaxID=3138568 RepID=UPI0031F675F3